MDAVFKLILLLLVLILAAAADGLLVYGVHLPSGPELKTETQIVRDIPIQPPQRISKEATTDQGMQPVASGPQTEKTPSAPGEAKREGASRTIATATPSLSPATRTIPPDKVIGNRDSRRYHLPGMVYFDKVEAYHRVEFRSEEEAIKAGYRKAVQ